MRGVRCGTVKSDSQLISGSQEAKTKNRVKRGKSTSDERTLLALLREDGRRSTITELVKADRTSTSYTRSRFCCVHIQSDPHLAHRLVEGVRTSWEALGLEADGSVRCWRYLRGYQVCELPTRSLISSQRACRFAKSKAEAKKRDTIHDKVCRRFRRSPQHS